MYLKLGTQLPYLKLGTQQSGTAPAAPAASVTYATASLNGVVRSVYVSNASAVLTRIGGIL